MTSPKHHPLLEAVRRRQRLFGLLIVGAIFYFIIAALAREWEVVRDLSVRLRWSLLLLSCVPVLINYMLLAWIWSVIARILGHDLPMRRAFMIFSIAQITKYLPGKVWPTVSVLHLGDRVGLPKTGSGLILTFQYLFQALSAALIWIFIIASTGAVQGRLFMIVALAAAAGAVAHPSVLKRLATAILRLSHKQSPAVEISYFQSFFLLMLTFLYWTVGACGLLLLLRAFVPADPAILAGLMGVLAASWVTANLAFFIPGGLGVREGTMALLLGLLEIPRTGALLVSIVFRLRMIACELLAAAVGSLIYRVERGE